MARTLLGLLLLAGTGALVWHLGLPVSLWNASPYLAAVFVAGVLIDEQFLPGVSRVVAALKGVASKSGGASVPPSAPPSVPPGGPSDGAAG